MDRERCLPTHRVEAEVYLLRLLRRRRFVRRVQTKRLTPAGMLDFGRPFPDHLHLAVLRVGGLEDSLLPIPEIGFGVPAGRSWLGHFLDSFGAPTGWKCSKLKN
jgi:hypothetical protein